MPETIASQYDLTQFNGGPMENAGETGIGGTIIDLLANPSKFWEGKVKGGDAARSAEQLTREYNEALEQARWNRETAYNSPIQQMARLREAGLNPHLAYGDGAAAGQASANATPGHNPIKQVQGSMPNVLGKIFDFVRLRREKAALDEQEIKNAYLEDKLKDESVYRNLRNEAQQVVNDYLPDLTYEGLQARKAGNRVLGYQEAQAYSGLLYAATELKAAGANDEQIKEFFDKALPKRLEYDDGTHVREIQGRERSLLSVLYELAEKEYKAGHTSLEAQMSEDNMSKVLSGLGLHEGDPLHQRLTAMLNVGKGGQTAMAIGQYLLDQGLKIFGASQTATGNAVRNAYYNSMTNRNQWMRYQPSVNLGTGETFGFGINSHGYAW